MVEWICRVSLPASCLGCKNKRLISQNPLRALAQWAKTPSRPQVLKFLQSSNSAKSMTKAPTLTFLRGVTNPTCTNECLHSRTEPRNWAVLGSVYLSNRVINSNHHCIMCIIPVTLLLYYRDFGHLGKNKCIFPRGYLNLLNMIMCMLL